ncbi:histidine triad nucleotide-binding protein [Natranaerofaba carboxydovora]|uniref:histidine triad nucleotide-binding protein n=1 Tax=Natranaerofaba carboxydovora TaxID=2742683 RepID=UPI001F138EA4|nr:histidine triad nucleotide-binding protein [Natranaerofaba carboxydovora]UMZ73079.1 Purine nucleoside phosphoramidase [Natranaerofaba carboxydovora]
MAKDCLFCKIVNKEIDSDIVYEDDKVIVFKDINPKEPVHLLIVPKVHRESIMDLKKEDAELISHMVFVAQEIAKKYNIDDKEKGFNLLNNYGKEGGQEIDHLHVHFLAKSKPST